VNPMVKTEAQVAEPGDVVTPTACWKTLHLLGTH